MSLNTWLDLLEASYKRMQSISRCLVFSWKVRFVPFWRPYLFSQYRKIGCERETYRFFWLSNKSMMSLRKKDRSLWLISECQYNLFNPNQKDLIWREESAEKNTSSRWSFNISKNLMDLDKDSLCLKD